MNRAFSTREKILLLILAVLVVACCYYLMVLKPSFDTMTSSTLQLQSIEDEIAVQEALAVRKAQMEQEIADAEASGKIAKTLPAYDNTKNEITELNAILAEASSYDISFGEAEASGSLVRRQVDITFTADSYAAAQSVLIKLVNCRYSCVVGDVSISGESLGQASSVGRVSASATVTFFEAIQEGSPAIVTEAQAENA